MSPNPPAPTGATAGGIAVRPAVEPEVLAVLAAAADQAWPRRRLVADVVPVTLPAWRFSGRWWTRPAASRRSRPWA